MAHSNNVFDGICLWKCGETLSYNTSVCYDSLGLLDITLSCLFLNNYQVHYVLHLGKTILTRNLFCELSVNSRNPLKC